MSVSGSVMWAELQGELIEAGLDVVVGVSAEGYPWPGEIDGKPFRMSVPPRNDYDGEIDWLIVSLYGQDNEEKIVKYGLEPLTKAGILTNVEVKQVVDWFKKTEPTWDSNDRKGFAKIFKIDEITYELMTDCCRGYRDLNLHIRM